jgi:hypothetical protein
MTVRRRAALGRARIHDESLGVTSTDATAWKDALVFQLPEMQGGEYRIGWSYVWGGSRTQKTVDIRILIDTDVVGYQIERPRYPTTGVTDIGGIEALDYAVPVMGYGYTEIVHLSTPVVKIQVRSEPEATAYLALVRAEVW